jgi:thiamine kinase-like enzyme
MISEGIQLRSIIKDYLIKNGIKYNNIEIFSLDKGLSNFLYKVSVDGNLYFLKIFGDLEKYEIVNREFETILLENNSKLGLCPRVLDTDMKLFRIEEYMDNLNSPSDDVLLNEVFINSLIDRILDFQFSLTNIEFDNKCLQENSVFDFLSKIHKIGKDKLYDFISNLDNKNQIDQKILTVKYCLDNFPNYIDKLDLDSYKLILTHNDIHKGNIIVDQHNDVTGIIDYEYACYNLIGFDIINYLIESFFDLDYPVYPFYKCKNIDPLFYDNKFFSIYLLYLDKLRKKDFISHKEYDSLKDKNYYLKVLSLCSLFWFASSTIFINYNESNNYQKFNYIDYSLDRISIYEKANEFNI